MNEPDFGYISPKRTKKECSNPEFADKHFHRVGLFKKEYLPDEMTGWVSEARCVSCGKVFKGSGTHFFHPGKAESTAEEVEC